MPTTVNLVPNPGFRDLGGNWWAWFPGTSTGVRTAETGQTGWANGLTTAGRITFTSAVADGDGGGLGAFEIPVEAGKPFKVRGQVRVSKANRVMLWVDLYDDALNFAAPIWVSAMAAPGEVISFDVSSGLVPAGVTKADVYLMANYPDSFGGPGHQPFLAGDWIEGTGLLVSQDGAVGEPVPDYFDGLTPDTSLVSYFWTGAPNNSPSQKVTSAAVSAAARGDSHDSPFLITVYDKDFQRKGWVGGYEIFSATPKHNLAGFASWTLRADHPRILDLMTPGARAVIHYDDDFLMSGTVRGTGGQGPADLASIDFKLEDDLRVLNQILGWPNPGESIFNQGYDDDGEMLGDYHRISGRAETVLKAFVNANVPRLAGLPLTTAPDLQRGEEIDVRMRFHPLTDRLLPAVEAAGLGVTVRQQDGGLVLDVYEPQVRLRPLTEASGVLASWNWETTAPTNSRVVVGGQGEGVDRDFRLKTDLAREAEWGGSYVSEFFRDARDVDLGNYGLLDKRADQSLLEGAAKSGLSVTLTETDTFRYGRTVVVGDQVTIAVAPGVEVTDVLRTATLTHSITSGLHVTPAVGEPPEGSSDMLIARAIQQLARSLRDLKAR